MNTQHTGHRSENSVLGEHFSVCGVETIMLQNIDCVNEGADEALDVLESFKPMEAT